MITELQIDDKQAHTKLSLGLKKWSNLHKQFIWSYIDVLYLITRYNSSHVHLNGVN